jgi:spore coat-associated protein N
MGQMNKHRTTTRKLAATVVVLLAFAALVSVGTLALFTDSQAVGGNAFTTGNVDISTAPTSALVTFSNMAPGDTVTDDIVVTNGGSLALRYAISSSATNADSKGLKDQLVLTVNTIDKTLPATPCDDFDGDQLYTGDLDDGAGGKLVGDAASGFQAGDRNLAASRNETLCFRVNLPTTTGNAFQNATTTATFTFDAEQTANN